jgi:hypothetical protein
MGHVGGTSSASGHVQAPASPSDLAGRQGCLGGRGGVWLLRDGMMDLQASRSAMEERVTVLLIQCT